MKAKKISYFGFKRKEDYLRVILELSQGKEEGTRSRGIATTLKISKPSVSEMLNKLKKLKLVEFKPYSQVFLTNKGRKQAENILQKHELIEKFASRLGHENPHNEAHQLEHHFSKGMLIKLHEFMEGKTKIRGNLPGYIN